jgi:hypothetical protein
MNTIATPRSQGTEQGLSDHHAGLGRYTSTEGVERELVTEPGAGGSTLVIDRVTASGEDQRLVGQLAAEEPEDNAVILSRLYLDSPHRGCCRPVMPEDLRDPGPTAPAGLTEAICDVEQVLVDAHGFRYQLAAVHHHRRPLPELRWKCQRTASGRSPGSVSLREVVGALENYEPARAITAAALQWHAEDRSLSLVRLREELERLHASPIVLNRGLREAVRAAVARGELTRSEIALRCGRAKRDLRGNLSGETSWLARRIGEVPESGSTEPGRWIHSDVLARVARDGLGIDPADVELG